MSNPFDSSIEALRTAEPRPDAVDRTVAALRRSHPPRLVPLAVGVAAVSALILWPHGSSGVAWAQIADQDPPMRYHETRVVIARGKARITNEQWVDRTSDSQRNRVWLFRGFPESGKSLAANPLDREDEFIESPKGFYGNLNGFATFTRRPMPKSRFDPRLSGNARDRIGLEKLLGDKAIHQLGVERNVETRVGRADRYELDRPAFTWEAAHRRYRETGRDRFSAFVQPGTQRILGMDSAERSGDVYQTTFEYPDRFAADLFAFPPKGVKAYDLDALNAQVAARLARPLADLRAGGQEAVLRLVAQDDQKDLWVLWSGAKPNGDLAQRVRVLGMPNGAAHSALPYVSKDSGMHHSPFGGESILLSRRVDHVSLQIPVFAPGVGRSRFVDTATARNVPVLHLPFVDGLDSLRGRKVAPSMVNVINARIRK